MPPTVGGVIEARAPGHYPPGCMTYPRACPSCGANEPSPEQLYSTRAAIDGGTPSPWRLEAHGRLLDLRCGACWALFRWDYFGSRMVSMLSEGKAGDDADAAATGDA